MYPRGIDVYLEAKQYIFGVELGPLDPFSYLFYAHSERPPAILAQLADVFEFLSLPHRAKHQRPQSSLSLLISVHIRLRYRILFYAFYCLSIFSSNHSMQLCSSSNHRRRGMSRDRHLTNQTLGNIILRILKKKEGRGTFFSSSLVCRNVYRI